MSTGSATRASASERAYRHVKRGILQGRLDGGDLISEGQVADALKISRTPVREAFLRLEAEGLLRLYPKRGALVVPVSAREIEEVVEARVVFEQFAARKLIARGGHEPVAAAMRALIDRQRQAASSGRPDVFSDLDRDFHELVMAASGNSILCRHYDGLRDRQIRMNIATLRGLPARYDEILDEHTKLCDLLAAGDADSLCDLLAAHITRTGAVARGVRQ